MSSTASAVTGSIVFLNPGDPPESFPDLIRGTTEPDGLVAVGGDLTPARLLAAYGRGIFPWYEEGQPVLWWSPDPRAVLLPERIHISRTLRRTLMGKRFQVSVDLAFGAVINACADTRAATGTWITPEMRSAYLALHNLGYAHSIEVWQGSDLAGGLYGIALGDVFFGESMFSQVTDASKAALVKLVRLAEDQGITLIDCQVATHHLATLGSQLMPRDEFLGLLRTLSVARGRVGAWRTEPRPTQSLVRTPEVPAPLHV
jgi:leucyl/phenylalanyl-tRNA--protein transferase